MKIKIKNKREKQKAFVKALNEWNFYIKKFRANRDRRSKYHPYDLRSHKARELIQRHYKWKMLVSSIKVKKLMMEEINKIANDNCILNHYATVGYKSKERKFGRKISVQMIQLQKLNKTFIPEKTKKIERYNIV